jgi:hypothetical protein
MRWNYLRMGIMAILQKKGTSVQIYYIDSIFINSWDEF